MQFQESDDKSFKLYIQDSMWIKNIFRGQLYMELATFTI